MKLVSKKEGEIYKILKGYLEFKKNNYPLKIHLIQSNIDLVLKELSKYFPEIYSIQYFNPKIFKNKDNKHQINIIKLDENLKIKLIKTYYI